MTRVLVTGASGFVGRFVCAALAARGIEAIAGVRDQGPGQFIGGATGSVRIGPGASPAQLTSALRGADAVIHLAAAVHDMRGGIGAVEYQQVNRDYPLSLARAAVEADVSRFVFASTIKVNGDSTAGSAAFSEASPVVPRGPYALSKWQAEEGLLALSVTTGLSTCSVRPPLVYGPGVRANFLSLMRWVRRGLPLPFAALNNARSLIYVENLADLLVQLAVGPARAASAHICVACDGEDLSTPDLVRGIARSLGVPPRLFSVPEPVLRGALSAFGGEARAQRLLGSLRVDATLVRTQLGWTPPCTVAEGLARTAAWLEGQP